MAKKRKSVEPEAIESQDITYKAFFSDCLLKGLVKPWQEKEILVFFKQLGLDEKEPLDKYEDALPKY